MAPPNPLRGVVPDAAYIAGAARRIEGPVLLVGHSYGGAVITAAGTQASNVVGLVYVSAFAPDEGEAIVDIVARFPDGLLGPALRATPFPSNGHDGTEMHIDPELFPAVFAADLPSQLAAVMAVSQRPLALAGLVGKLEGSPAWKALPAWCAVASADLAIQPDAVRFMAKRMNAQTVEVDASHAIVVSQPAAIAELIGTAVEETRVRAPEHREGER